MSNDGKHLEDLVALVEEQLVQDGFDVERNSRVYNDEGVQVAEFDVQVRGKVGSTDIAWLIECRDRPGSGAASASWIEQLHGRRARFGFNKVTAVSTTGFTAGAVDFAARQGIELREVESLSPEHFSSWLRIEYLIQVTRLINLESASFFLPEGSLPEDFSALDAVLKGVDGNAPILEHSKTGECVAAKDAFRAAVSDQKGLLESVKPNEPGVKVRIRAIYSNDDDHFVIRTEVGPLRVQEIIFSGEVVAQETKLPISSTRQYVRSGGKETISQIVSFAPHDILGKKMSLEIHKIEGAENMQVVIRNVGNV